MKNISHKILSLLTFATIGVAVMSCDKDKTDELALKRMFKPSTIETTNGETSVTINWSASLFTEGAVEYVVEVSPTLEFTDIVHTVTSSERELVITDEVLVVRQDYFARIKAKGLNGAEDSNWTSSEAFRVTGEQFLIPLNDLEVLDKAIIVRWLDKPGLTKIVFTPDGGESFDVVLDEADLIAGQKIIEDLLPNTLYMMELFQGELSKGIIEFMTKAGIGGNGEVVIDLREILGNPNILVDTLPDIPNGAIVVLKRGEIYTLSSSYAFDKSVTILSGLDFADGLAQINLTSNFNFVAGIPVDSIVFQDIQFKGSRPDGASFNSDYVINANVATNVGIVKLEGCRVSTVRGVVRLQAGGAGAHVANYIINNCVIDSVREFAVVMASAASSFTNVKITNSTITRARRFVNHGVPGNNFLIIENCTFNELPTGQIAGGNSNYFIDFNAASSANPIVLKNCIVGKTWIETVDEVDVRGYRGAGPISVVDSYATSDFVSTNAEFQLGLSVYGGSSTSVFVDPAAGNFGIKDNGFPGKNAGDPRWQ